MREVQLAQVVEILGSPSGALHPTQRVERCDTHRDARNLAFDGICRQQGIGVIGLDP
jgi:hypothetical protein